MPRPNLESVVVPNLPFRAMGSNIDQGRVLRERDCSSGTGSVPTSWLNSRPAAGGIDGHYKDRVESQLDGAHPNESGSRSAGKLGHPSRVEPIVKCRAAGLGRGLITAQSGADRSKLDEGDAIGSELIIAVSSWRMIRCSTSGPGNQWSNSMSAVGG
jgi:hypothetical protein